MKLTKKIVTLFVVLSMVAVFAVNGIAAEKTNPDKSVKADKSGLININTAGAEELMKLPRIGPKMSQRIITFRKENGKFKKIQDLMKVPGIGEKTFAGLKHMVTI